MFGLFKGVLMLLIFKLIANKNIKLGMMSPFRHPRLGFENNAAAATIAIDKAISEGIINGVNIT